MHCSPFVCFRVGQVDSNVKHIDGDADARKRMNIPINYHIMAESQTEIGLRPRRWFSPIGAIKLYFLQDLLLLLLLLLFVDSFLRFGCLGWPGFIFRWTRVNETIITTATLESNPKQMMGKCKHPLSKKKKKSINQSMDYL